MTDEDTRRTYGPLFFWRKFIGMAFDLSVLLSSFAQPRRMGLPWPRFSSAPHSCVLAIEQAARASRKDMRRCWAVGRPSFQEFNAQPFNPARARRNISSFGRS